MASIRNLCLWGRIKKSYTSYYLRSHTCWNFKRCWYTWCRVLEFSQMIWHTCTKGAQLQHFNMVTYLENLSLEVWRVYAFPGQRKCHQPIPINSSSKCMTVVECPGNSLSTGTARLHPHDKWQSKYTSKHLKDRCQHFRHRGTQMDRHVNLLCMAFDIVLTHKTVQHIKADVLQYCNISTKWVGALNDDNRATRMMACLSFLQC
jgi:hypothetical protein